jgi:hypothetical protein
MNFAQGDVYLDRDNRKYTFIERRGSVLVFEDVTTKKNVVLNSVGRYRWDNQDDNRDIVAKA